MNKLQTTTTPQVITTSSNTSWQVTGAWSVYVGLGTDVPPTIGFTYQPGIGDRGEVARIFDGAAGNTVWAWSSVPSEITFT